MSTAETSLSDDTRALQAESRYLALLHGPWGSAAAPLFRTVRDATQLITVALRHGDLSLEQRQELGHFRLQQFVLWGWYDLEASVVQMAQSDPAFAVLSPEAIHVMTGTLDGRLLAYMCIEPAVWQHGQAATADMLPVDFTFGQRHRPLFPTEMELSGSALFASLPLLGDLSIEQVREPSCLLRNQAVQTPLSIAAGVDVFCTAAELLMAPALGLRALVGHGDSELRTMMASLGIPALYAPLAPAAPVLREPYWARDMDTPGKFWPFVIPIQDLRAHAEHLRHLTEILGYPERDLRRALVRMRKAPHMTPPRSLLPTSHSSPVYWTADPTFTPAREAVLVSPAPHYHETH